MSLAHPTNEQEHFGLRAMRHLWRVSDNRTTGQWEVLLRSIRGSGLSMHADQPDLSH